MSKKPAPAQNRRAQGNQLGKLLKAHGQAAKDIASAQYQLSALKLMAVEDGDTAPYQDRIDELTERIGALQKFMADTYETIVKLNSGKLSRV